VYLSRIKVKSEIRDSGGSVGNGCHASEIGGSGTNVIRFRVGPCLLVKRVITRGENRISPKPLLGGNDGKLLVPLATVVVDFIVAGAVAGDLR